MLHHIFSSSLELLAENLRFNRKTELNPDQPWRSDLILIQNSGMKRWLSFQACQNDGVLTDTQYNYPASFVWEVSRRVTAYELDDIILSKKHVLIFSIFDWLTNPQLIERQSDIKQYLNSFESETEKRNATWVLAKSTASLFDEYEIYRPELILEKCTGKTDWMSQLWNDLCHEKDHHYRHQITIDALSRLATHNIEIQPLPYSNIHIFAIPTLPKPTINLLVLLSWYCNVNWYHFLPTHNELLQTDSIQNELTTYLSKEGRDMLVSIQQSEEQFDIKSDKINLDYEPQNRTLLTHLQHAIIKDKPNYTDLTGKPDRSVQVHATHHNYRQAEIVRDELLRLLNTEKDLKPSDILIMVSDLNQFAPVIQSVFDSSKTETGVEIPYSLSDQSLISVDAGIQSFLMLVQLLNSRITATELSDLMQNDFIAAWLEMEPEEVTLAETWIRESHIRWGLYADHKADFGLTPNAKHTLEYGFKQWFNGLTVEPKAEPLFDDITTNFDLFKFEHWTLFGKLSLLFKTIDGLNTIKKQALPIHELLKQLMQLLTSFGFFEPIYKQSEKQLDSSLFIELQRLSSHLFEITYSSSIEWDIFTDFCESFFSDSSVGSGFMNGGVTVSAMIPMRTIPFKVIIMMGMDDGSFPKKQKRPGFDWILKSPQSGDKSRLEDDNYLFLQTILSAKQTLILTYNGLTNKDNQKIEPSSLVLLLLEEIKKMTHTQPDKFITWHDLHGHNLHYFENFENGTFSKLAERMANRHRKVKEPQDYYKQIQSSLVQADEQNRFLELSELINFFKDPGNYYIKQVLGTYISDRDESFEDEEPFKADALFNYEIKKLLMEEELDQGDERTISSRHGSWPIGYESVKYGEEINQFMLQYRAILKEHKLKTANQVFDEVDIDDWRINGSFFAKDESTMLYLRPGKFKPKYKLEAWITMLFARIGNPDLAECLVIYDQDGLKSGSITIPNYNECQLLMSEYLKLFKEGQSTPLLFYPDTSFDLAKQKRVDSEKHNQLDKVFNTYTSERSFIKADSLDLLFDKPGTWLKDETSYDIAHDIFQSLRTHFPESLWK